MNPHSPEQKYPFYLVEQALGRCQQERENAEFFIEIKSSVLRTVREAREAINDLDEDIILPSGLILPSPRRILEHDEQYHAAEIERQKALLAEVKSAEATLRNAIRKHKQSYETLNLRKLVKKQLSYDRYHTLRTDLQKLEEDIASFNQDLDQAIVRLNQDCYQTTTSELNHQATTSSLTNSATSNND